MTSSSLAHVNRRLKRRYYRLGRHRKKPPDPGGGPPSAPHQKSPPRHHSRSRRHSYLPSHHNFPQNNASHLDYSMYILYRLPHYGIKADQPFRHGPRIAPLLAKHRISRATHRHLYYTSPTITQPTAPNNSQSPPPHPHYPYHDTLVGCIMYNRSGLMTSLSSRIGPN